MKGSIEVPYVIIPATPTTEAIMGKIILTDHPTKISQII
jgi:hypothetical protein